LSSLIHIPISKMDCKKDKNTNSNEITVAKAILAENERFLNVHWSANNQVDVYPFAWLRDSCQCPKCYSQHMTQRLVLLREVNMTATLLEVEIIENGTAISGTWDDGHVGYWPAAWMWQRRFVRESQDVRKRHIYGTMQLWGAEMKNNIPEFDLEEILTNDDELWKWCHAVETVGLVKVNAGPHPDQIGRIYERMGFGRSSHYGPFWTAKINPNDPVNVGYSSLELGLHTDHPFNRYPPEVMCLHFIEQTAQEGGDSLFSDGFNAANQLLAQDPEAFKALTETRFDFMDVGSDIYGPFSLIDANYTIQLDEEGDLFRITMHNAARDTHFRTTPEKAEKALQALKKFNTLLYSKENLLQMKPVAGDMYCVNNARVLHGRFGFKRDPNERRFIQNGYLDMDEISSKRRILKTSFEKPAITNGF